MGRILLAEDDDALRHFLTRALERAGHSVVSVGNGEDAIPVLAKASFDLLLADIVMPEMDGIELAQRAIGMQPKLRVIFITGFAAVALNQNRHGGLAAKVLAKPFHLRDLAEEVERTLAAGPGEGRKRPR